MQKVNREKKVHGTIVDISDHCYCQPGYPTLIDSVQHWYYILHCKQTQLAGHRRAQHPFIQNIVADDRAVEIGRDLRC